MQRAQEILNILKKEYPDAQCALVHKNAWELLVATILSAQCTDARVNMVTPILFSKYPTPEALAKADLQDIKTIIRSTGFYNNKAKSIKGAAEVLVNKYNGQVPDAMEDLVELPGVARKTANVVLSVWYKKNEGVVVDTHVKRLAKRYGLTASERPEEIEKELMQLFPEKDWERLSMLLIHHGRQVATAKNPKDEEDVLKKYIV